MTVMIHDVKSDTERQSGRETRCVCFLIPLLNLLYTGNIFVIVVPSLGSVKGGYTHNDNRADFAPI